MNKKNSILIALLLVMAGFYVVHFTDWFKPRIIQISSISRQGPVRFKFENANYKITELKVVPLAAFQTNKFILPVWSLVSDSNSVPTSGFEYGAYIPGMKPGVSGIRAKPLEPGTDYRLLVTTTEGKGQHDFQAKAR